MNRRDSLFALIALCAAPLPSDAQQSARPARIAWLGLGTPEANGYQVSAFRQGMRDLGYAEGNGASANFFYPYTLAVDINGIVYVVDSFNQRIRMITPTGITSLLAGSGSTGYTEGTGTNINFNFLYMGQIGLGGIAIDSSGVIYVADTANNMIRKLY